MKNLSVVYHSTDKFSWILGTSMTSLLENNKDVFFDFYIIENKISESNKDKIMQLEKKYNCKVEFIPLPDLPEKYGFKIKKIKENWLFDSFSRLFLGSILSNDISKVLYLDSDVIIDGSIDYLLDFDMNNYLIAGVKESLSKNYYSMFDIKNTYFQGGVFLINLDLWRDKQIEKKVVDYMNEKNGYVFFMEQTLVSYICDENVAILPIEYNWTTINCCFTYKQIVKMRDVYNWVSEEEYENAKKNPVIYHLTNCFYINNRCWQRNCNHPMVDLFLKYKEISPFKDKELYDGKKVNLKNFCIHLVPKFLLVRIVKILYNNLRVKKILKEMGENQ